MLYHTTTATIRMNNNDEAKIELCFCFAFILLDAITIENTKKETKNVFTFTQTV